MQVNIVKNTHSWVDSIAEKNLQTSHRKLSAFRIHSIG